jgi:hypothetical protein
MDAILVDSPESIIEELLTSLQERIGKPDKKQDKYKEG